MAGGGGRNWRLVRAGTDAVPSSARRFMARARQRRLRAALPWAVGAGVLALAGVLAWVVFGTAALGVREVRVTGTGVLSEQQVRDAAGVAADTPLARVDTDAVRARVQALAPVELADVSRELPGTVTVRVVERTPVAAVPTGPAVFTLIDRAGVAFRTVPQRPAGVPLAKLAAPGPGDVNTRAALTVLAALTPQLRERLAEISVRAPAQIRLGLRGNRVVVWGDDTSSTRKAQVATVLLARDGDTIDVSAPDVVTIR